MIYTNTELLNCLESRLKWYDKSIDMKLDKIPYENGFDFPYGSITMWGGARNELQNTIDMLTAKQH